MFGFSLVCGGGPECEAKAHGVIQMVVVVAFFSLSLMFFFIQHRPHRLKMMTAAAAVCHAAPLWRDENQKYKKNKIK